MGISIPVASGRPWEVLPDPKAKKQPSGRGGPRRRSGGGAGGGKPGFAQGKPAGGNRRRGKPGGGPRANAA